MIFLKKADPPPPIGAISDISKIENISMAVDPLGQTFKLAYLHQKRINFIQKGKNNSRSPWADLKKGILALENTK